MWKGRNEVCKGDSFLNYAEIVCAEEGNACQDVTRQPGIRGKQPDKRRRQGDRSQLNLTARKQPENLALLDPQHIGVAGVIDVKVIPENQALSLHHPQHLGGYLLFHTVVENGGEDQGLTDQIKGRIRKGELCRIPAQDCDSRRTRLSGCGHPLREQINANDMLWLGSPLDELPQPAPVSTANTQNLLGTERRDPVSPQ